MKRVSTPRAGYSLIELIVVITLLIILGAIVAPTLRTLSRDTKVQAGTDQLRGRMADARAAAIEDGRPYRVALSQDGRNIRIAPDDLEFSNSSTSEDDDHGPLIIEEELPETITAVPVLEEGTQAVVDQSGWIRVATFRPDGTCREAIVVIEVREPGSHSMVIRVRGLTGATSVTSAPQRSVGP